ncbi:Hypothetical predicted protein, partial [Podarcis lilfordi]
VANKANVERFRHSLRLTPEARAFTFLYSQGGPSENILKLLADIDGEPCRRRRQEVTWRLR